MPRKRDLRKVPSRTVTCSGQSRGRCSLDVNVITHIYIRACVCVCVCFLLHLIRIYSMSESTAFLLHLTPPSHQNLQHPVHSDEMEEE
jgi:hypothetical protein